GSEPACARDLDGSSIVVYADAVAIQMGKVPADAATQIQDEAGVKAPQVPSIGRLNRHDTLPSNALREQPLGILAILGGFGHDSQILTQSLASSERAPAKFIKHLREFWGR